MSILADPNFLAVFLSHFAVDMINSLRAVIFTYLSGPLALSNATIGLLTTVYLLVGSLSQPVFGMFNDKIGTRWVLFYGLVWIIGFLFLAVIFPGWPSIIFILVGSLGSGAVHPAGTAQSTLLGRLKLKGQETTAYSMFSLAGQTGYFIGPIIGGLLLDALGFRGLGGIALLTLPVAVLVFRIKEFASTARVSTTVESKRRFPTLNYISLILLFAIATSQTWAQQTIGTFLPKYLSDAGWSASQYGLLASIFMGGSAVGVYTGARIADKIGKWKVILAGLSLGSIPYFFLPAAGLGPWLSVLVIIAGLLTGSTFASIIVLAQSLIPVGMGLASGLTMGLTFAFGAIGTFISGMVADSFGFVPVFYLGGALSLVGGLLAVYFRKS